MSNIRDVWQLNGATTVRDNPCAGNLRPGRAAYAESLGGGLNFRIIVAHADSGTKDRDFQHRQTTLERLDNVFADLNGTVSDSDIIVLGDLNTMGAQALAGAKSEIELLGRVSARGSRVPSPGACTGLHGVLPGCVRLA